LYKFLISTLIMAIFILISAQASIKENKSFRKALKWIMAVAVCDDEHPVNAHFAHFVLGLANSVVCSYFHKNEFGIEPQQSNKVW